MRCTSAGNPCVVSVDAACSKMTVKVGEKGVEKVLLLAPDVKVKKAGADIKLSDLKAGDVLRIPRRAMQSGKPLKVILVPGAKGDKQKAPAGKPQGGK